MKLIHCTLLFTCLFAGCTATQSHKEENQPNASQTQNKNADADHAQTFFTFVEETGFSDLFIRQAQGKTWKDVDIFYKESLVKYADNKHLDVLKPHIMLSFLGVDHVHLILKNDGSNDAKTAIAYYAQELKKCKSGNPAIALHWVKNLQGIWTSNEIKAYAQHFVNKNTADYQVWKDELDNLLLKTSKNNAETHTINVYQRFISNTDSLKILAN